MARLFEFECSCGNYREVKRVEYNPPSNSRPINPGRHVIDLDKPADHLGYPTQIILCPSCHEPVEGREQDLTNSIPPVFFNYMGDDD